ncbi:MHYT domain-containing protein [Longimicrobium terrae]|uniref:histidine kinase n=1 Tax=Longimicrobium terrae TaxID=1639882 RepID=A0A841GY77_9BACT|nr:MHYT domain-containing protein [Longimicrobium terrae]MBB4636283.1 PAS domain S-box-containing protein [Longimicrobium terrae]MBB6070679.1 PAS domain S-box-containing protein [Longimicrobium terrae]NNC29661.1 GAF domain-containing protein [Longimicrobium terrae]
MKGSYSTTLVVFSVVIAILASYTALVLAARVSQASGRFRAAWLTGGSLALGIGVWSMHFVGMLAFRLDVPITYDVPRWIVSMVVAVAASLLALWVTSRPRVTALALAAASLLMGAGIAGMHYVGMAAMRIHGVIRYDPVRVAESVAVAVGASGAALWLALRYRNDDTRRGLAAKMASAVVMGLAIAGMHYTAMSAAHFRTLPGPMLVPDDHVLRTNGLASGVVLGTLVVLGITLLTTLVDRRLRTRTAEAEAARRSAARFRSLVTASSQVVFTTGPEGAILAEQPQWAAYTGMEFEAYRGWGWLNAIHPDERERAACLWREAVEEVRDVDAMHRVLRTDGEWRLLALRAVAVTEEDGGIREWVGAASDVTERQRAEAGRELLAEASRVLVSSLDFETTLASVARLVVPALADWCAVDMLTEDGVMRRLAVEHTDPAKVKLVRQIEERWPTDLDAPYGVSSVLRTGKAEIAPEIPDALLVANTREAAQLAAVRALGLRSYVCVPLIARGKVLGAISLVYAESGRRYDDEDLALAEELARRAAVAIDNARLFGETEEARVVLEQQTGELEEAQAEMEMAHEELQHAYENLAERTIEAERARAAADDANAAKSAFLATMSHELRTPLNAIAGYTQLLEMGIHGPVTQPQREALEKIHRNQTHLLGLINDVLNFAKIEAGHVQYELREVPLDEVLRSVEPLVEPQIRAKELRYTYAGGDPAVTACADRDRLEQIVLNLLSNAVKFTDRRGAVQLEWTVEGNSARISVRDTGRGIPPDKLEAIFEPFVQVDPALTRAAEGTGLGLAISRDLARAMEGDLVAVSQEGEGSTFTLTLPLGRPTAGAQPARDAAAD